MCLAQGHKAVTPVKLKPVARQRERDEFVWESVCVAITFLKACTCLCTFFKKSLYLYRVKIATKKQHDIRF